METKKEEIRHTEGDTGWGRVHGRMGKGDVRKRRGQEDGIVEDRGDRWCISRGDRRSVLVGGTRYVFACILRV